MNKAYLLTIRQNKKKPADKMCHVSVAVMQVCQKTKFFVTINWKIRI